MKLRWIPLRPRLSEGRLSSDRNNRTTALRRLTCANQVAHFENRRAFTFRRADLPELFSITNPRPCVSGKCNLLLPLAFGRPDKEILAAAGGVFFHPNAHGSSQNETRHLFRFDVRALSRLLE